MSSGVSSLMPRPRASAAVASEVGTPRTSRPAATRWASARRNAGSRPACTCSSPAAPRAGSRRGCRVGRSAARRRGWCSGAWRRPGYNRFVPLADDASFRLLFDANPLPMWVYDVASLAFLEVNAAAVEHYGYSREEFLRMKVTALFPPEEDARVREAVARLSETPQPGLRHHAPAWKP